MVIARVGAIWWISNSATGIIFIGDRLAFSSSRGVGKSYRIAFSFSVVFGAASFQEPANPWTVEVVLVPIGKTGGEAWRPRAVMVYPRGSVGAERGYGDSRRQGPEGLPAFSDASSGPGGAILVSG